MAVTIELNDRSAKFLPFYEMAQGKTPDERWALWKEHYGLAMIPPGPDGQAMARRMLDACWDRYPEVMDRIKAGAAGMTPSPQSVADLVAAALQLDSDLLIRVVTFVAMMENNAFSHSQDGVPHVVLPVEADAEVLGPLMAHEFGHAVHFPLSGIAERYPTTVAERIMMEGVAIGSAMAAYPGLPDESYVAYEPGWFAQCQQHEKAICQAALEHLNSEDMDTYHKFILGPGPGAGLQREVYYAGYRVMKHMLEHGKTLAQLARVPAADLERVVGGALREIIGG